MNKNNTPFSTGIGGITHNYTINGITYIAETRFQEKFVPLDDRFENIICSTPSLWTEERKECKIDTVHLCQAAGKEE